MDYRTVIIGYTCFMVLVIIAFVLTFYRDEVAERDRDAAETQDQCERE
jgi:hypothetical protein